MAKRSRRERRLETEKQKQFTPKASSIESPVTEAEPSAMLTEEFIPEPAKMPQPAPVNNRKAAAINFAHEYHYVFSELTTILIVTVIMIAVMIGLSFAI